MNRIDENGNGLAANSAILEMLTMLLVGAAVVAQWNVRTAMTIGAATEHRVRSAYLGHGYAWSINIRTRNAWQQGNEAERQSRELSRVEESGRLAVGM
mgnify:CR=1 FL=1